MIAIVDVWEGTHWDEVIVGLAAVVSAVAVINRIGIRPLRRKIDRMVDAWEWIEAQLNTNGGSTIKDQLDRLEEATSALQDMPRHMSAFARRLDRIEKFLKLDDEEVFPR